MTEDGYPAPTVGARGVRWDFTFNVGTLIHLTTILIAAFMVWHAIDKQQAIQQEHLDDVVKQIRVVDDRTERIETWLLMHDGEYLKKKAEQTRGRE
jgi:hypothetical protein